MVIGLVTVTWMIVVVVGSTPDVMLVVVEVLILELEENSAFVEMNVLLDEIIIVEVEVDGVGVGVGRQEQAEEIRDGSPAQCETKEGRPVVAVCSAFV